MYYHELSKMSPSDVPQYRTKLYLYRGIFILACKEWVQGKRKATRDNNCSRVIQISLLATLLFALVWCLKELCFEEVL